MPLKINNGETIKNNFQRFYLLQTSERKPLKLESDRGKEWYKVCFPKFFES